MTLVAFIAEELADRDGISVWTTRFSVHTEHLEDTRTTDGPQNTGGPDALAWARTHARHVVLDIGGERFSAGESAYRDLPAWSGEWPRGPRELESACRLGAPVGVQVSVRAAEVGDHDLRALASPSIEVVGAPRTAGPWLVIDLALTTATPAGAADEVARRVREVLGDRVFESGVSIFVADPE